jgi:Tol biopolymer transport system component
MTTIGETGRTARRSGRQALALLAAAGVLSGATAADAEAQTCGDVGLELLSRTPAGLAGNGLSGVFGLGISADGESVAFSSMATDLGPPDAGASPDVYVQRLDGRGPLVLASAAPDGTSGDAPSTRPSLSGDGSRVAFLSAATNLDPRAGGRLPRAFVADLAAGEVRAVSTTAGDEPADGPTSAVAISADGRTVAFISTATNLSADDADTDPDVFVKDLDSGQITLASMRADGDKPPVGLFGVASVSLSADGSRVGFSTDAALDDADDNGRADVYVKDLATGAITLASSTADGVVGDGASTTPTLTAAGDAVVFSTFAADFDERDASSDQDVYVKDLASGALQLASTTADGEKTDAGASQPAISGDGAVVSFVSRSTNLGAPPSERPQLQVYAKLLTTGHVTLISAAPDGTPGDATSLLSALSGDGSHAAFSSTSTNLCPGDDNRVSDVYLAHPFGLGGRGSAPDDADPPQPDEGLAPDATAAASTSVGRHGRRGGRGPGGRAART